MESDRKADARALRALPYSILIRVITSAAMFVCMACTCFAAQTEGTLTTAVNVMCEAAMMVAFINCVIMAVILDRISPLSARFSTAYKLMIAGIATECLMLLITIVEIWLAMAELDLLAVILSWSVMVAIAFKRVVFSGSLMQIMKGLGDALGQADQPGQAEKSAPAASLSRLGNTYMIYSCICVAIIAVLDAAGSIYSDWALTVMYLANTVFEVIMFRKALKATFAIWRKRAFGISGETVRKLVSDPN